MTRVYHRDQAGAPSLTAGTTSGLGFAAFKEVLKACLIYGYGSQPAAGWELVFESTDRLALRNGTHTGYVGFYHSADRIWLSVSETFTGFASSLISGDGVKSGTAASNATSHRLYPRYLVYGANAYAWSVIADAKTFVLNWQNGGSFTSAIELITADSGTQSLALYVGEDSAGNFIAVGGENTTNSSSNVGYFDYQGFTPLRDPSTGLLVGSGALVVATPGLENAPPVNSKVSALAQAPLSRALWVAGGVQGGYLRGVVLCPVIARLYPSHAAQSLGFSGALTSRNANTSLALGDAYSYFVSPGYYSSTRLITDNPEFW